MTPRKAVCPSCGPFEVTGLNTTVYRWRGADPAHGERRAVSFCPGCDRRVGQRVGVEVATVLAAQGAELVTFRRPAEVDEAKWRDRCPPQSKVRAGQVARVAFSFHTVDSLAYELTELAEQEGL